jgi:hypothetical protein
MAALMKLANSMMKRSGEEPETPIAKAIAAPMVNAAQSALPKPAAAPAPAAAAPAPFYSKTNNQWVAPSTQGAEGAFYSKSNNQWVAPAAAPGAPAPAAAPAAPAAPPAAEPATVTKPPVTAAPTTEPKSLYEQATVVKPAPAPPAPAPAAAAPLPDWIQNIQAEQAKNPMGPMPEGVPLPAPAAPPAAATPAPAAPPAAPAPPAAQPTAPPAMPTPTPAPAAAPVAPTSIYKSTMDQSVIDGAQYTPTTQAFDEAKGVEGRTASIIDKASPLMQRAETRALQQMNRRGLMNSSMAVGAGQTAVIDAASQIANADAGYSQQQALANQNAQNAAAQANAAMRGNLGMEGRRLDESGRQFDAGQASTTDRFNRELGENTRQFDATIAQRSEQFTQDMANKLQLAGVDRQTRLDLIAAETESRNLIAGNENIANAWGTTMNSIDKIQNNPDIEASAKTALINNALAGFQSFTRFWQKATGGAVDVSALLDFGVQGGQAGTPAAGGGTGGGTGGSTNTYGPVMPGSPGYDYNPNQYSTGA